MQGGGFIAHGAKSKVKEVRTCNEREYQRCGSSHKHICRHRRRRRRRPRIDSGFIAVTTCSCATIPNRSYRRCAPPLREFAILIGAWCNRMHNNAAFKYSHPSQRNVATFRINDGPCTTRRTNRDISLAISSRRGIQILLGWRGPILIAPEIH